jgi:hypothetical protein
LNNYHTLKIERPDQYIFHKNFETVSTYRNSFIKDVVKLASYCGYDLNKDIRNYYPYATNYDTIAKAVNTATIHGKTAWRSIGNKEYPIEMNKSNCTNLIFNHLFPEFKKLRKSKFQNLIENYPIRVENYDPNDVVFGLLRFRRTIAFSMREQSDIIAFDIDNHYPMNIETIPEKVKDFKKSVVNFFGEDNIILIEESLAHGLHVFVKLNRVMTREERSKIKESFEENEYYRLTETPVALRLFGSLNYKLLKDFDNEYKNTTEAVYACISKYEKSKGYGVIVCSEPIAEIKKDESAWVKEHINYTTRKKESAYYVRYKKTKPINADDWIISDGDRYKKQFNLCRKVYYRGGSAEDVYDILSTNGSSSADIRNWQGTDRWKKSIDKAFKTCVEKSTITPNANQTLKVDAVPDSLISNKDLVPDNVKKYINNKRILKTICERIGFKVKDQNLEIIKEHLSEMVGRAFYDCAHPKQIKEKVPDIYKEGFQFSKLQFNYIKQNNEELYKNRNPYLIGLAILNYSGLFKKHYRHLFFKKAQEFNKVTQWLFISNKEMYYYNDSDRLLDIVIKSFKGLLSNTYSIIKYNSYVLLDKYKDIKKHLFNLYISEFFPSMSIVPESKYIETG